MTLTDLAITCEATAADALGELPDDVETLAHMLVDARKAQRALGDTARMIETKLAEVMTSKVVTIEGLGTFEKRWSAAKIRWEHETIARRVAAASRDERILNESTGEIEGESEACARVLLGAAGIGYWRTGELKRLGIDPDKVREKEGGRLSVQVTAP